LAKGLELDRSILLQVSENPVQGAAVGRLAEGAADVVLREHGRELVQDGVDRIRNLPRTAAPALGWRRGGTEGWLGGAARWDGGAESG